jgi:hypothetical protein
MTHEWMLKPGIELYKYLSLPTRIWCRRCRKGFWAYQIRTDARIMGSECRGTPEPPKEDRVELVMLVCKQCKRRFYRPQGVTDEFCCPACEADHKLVEEKKR